VSTKRPYLYYNGSLGTWLMEVGQHFLTLDKRDAGMHLRVGGLSPEEYVGNLTEIENAFYRAQCDRAVDYAGPLAGHVSGPLKLSDGRTVLITTSPRMISPKRGRWPCLSRFFGELFGDEAPFALAWLKCAFESLAKGDFRASQLLAVAGEAGCGKSLFQAVVTEVLGGRVGKPYRYMMGETSFNADLAACEHWCIEDENGSTDIRTRLRFGDKLKDAVANSLLSVHGKGKQAITLPSFRRVTLSVNSEPEHLCILPPMSPSIADKITLLKCSHADVGNDRKKTWKEFTGELPAFVHHLLAMEIPKELRCQRYGVKAYHNPELFEALNSVAPEMRLLSLIDEVVKDGFAGTSEELERALRSSSFCFAVEKLLYFPTACGVYLSRLAGKFPDRVTSARANGRTRWEVRSAPTSPA
jgi:hypothetical protein